MHWGEKRQGRGKLRGTCPTTLVVAHSWLTAEVEFGQEQKPQAWSLFLFPCAPKSSAQGLSRTTLCQGSYYLVLCWDRSTSYLFSRRPNFYGFGVERSRAGVLLSICDPCPPPISNLHIHVPLKCSQGCLPGEGENGYPEIGSWQK